MRHADLESLTRQFNGKKRQDLKVTLAMSPKTAKLEEIEKHDCVLTPGLYVGAADVADDGEVFEDKMARLTATLSQQFAEGARLEAEMRKNLAWPGYGL